jgi:hypothetical protein
MSENTQAPAATPAPTSEATPSAPATKEARKAGAVSALKEMLAARNASAQAERASVQAAGAAAAAKPAAPAPEAAKTIEKIEAAGGEAPDQKAGESDTSYQLRLAKAFKEQRLASMKAENAEKQVAMTTAELKKLQQLLASGKENPLAILEHLGVSFPDLVKGINDDKYKMPEKSSIPPELAAKLARLEAAEAAREEKRLADARQAERGAHERQVSEFVKAHADRFPLASSLANVEKTIVDHAYKSGKGDVEAILQELETNLEGDVMPLASNEKALAKLLKSKPELKATLMKVLGLSEPVAEVEPEHTSVGGLSTEPGTPSARTSKEKRKAEAIAMMKANKRK